MKTNIAEQVEERTKISQVYCVSGAIWTTPNGPDDGGICLLKADRNEQRTRPCERDANVHYAAHCMNLHTPLIALLGLIRNEFKDKNIETLFLQMADQILELNQGV